MFGPIMRSPSCGASNFGAGTGIGVGMAVGTPVLPGVRSERVAVRVDVGELVGVGVNVGGTRVGVRVGRNVAVAGGRVAKIMTVIGTCVNVGVGVIVDWNARLIGKAALN